MSEQQYNDNKYMEQLRQKQADALAKAQATGHPDDLRRLSMINQKIHVERNRKSQNWVPPVEFAVLVKR